MIIVGTAGWSLPRSAGRAIPDSGSHLSRYSRVLHGTEINSSFARWHSTKTYAKWAKSTPRGFRFAVKMNQAITHDARLRRARKPLEQFLTEVAGLGSKLGPLLVQLPPSLEFDSRVAREFFDLIRQLQRRRGRVPYRGMPAGLRLRRIICLSSITSDALPQTRPVWTRRQSRGRMAGPRQLPQKKDRQHSRSCGAQFKYRDSNGGVLSAAWYPA